jgi:hypothetical protein
MRGGKGFGSPWEPVYGYNSGASGYVTSKVGGLQQQYESSLVGSGSGNTLPIVNGMGGGRRSRRSRRKYGGNIGAVYEAAVPLTLLAAQQLYKKKSRKSRKSRRY